MLTLKLKINVEYLKIPSEGGITNCNSSTARDLFLNSTENIYLLVLQYHPLGLGKSTLTEQPGV